MRKLRLWVCPCCKSYRRRIKGDGNAPLCRLCNMHYKPGRVYRNLKYRPCRHQRANRVISEFKDRVYTVPRCASGHALQVTPALRRAWAECRRAKTRPALIRRAQAWIVALEAESQRREGYSKYVAKDGTVHSSRTRGICGIPTIVPKAAPYVYSDVLGEYRRRPFDGVHEIAVATGRDLDDVRDTIVHEALHYLDAIAMISDNGHDCFWRDRLNRMRALFPTTAFGKAAP